MDKLELLYQESIRELEQLGIRPSRKIYSIRLNTRAKKRLGCCKKVLVNLIPGFEIEIASRLMEGEARQIREVILHEILHTCKGCFNHGRKWKDLAEKVNKTYGYHISRTADCNGDDEVYRYQVICKNCGNVSYRVRKSKVVKEPENYRCGKCMGPLKVKTMGKNGNNL